MLGIFYLPQSLFVAVNSNNAEDSPLFPRLAEQAWAIPGKIGSIEIGREEREDTNCTKTGNFSTHKSGYPENSAFPLQ